MAFAFVHLSFRALKQLTPVGRWEWDAGTNFTPGGVMILFTVCVLVLCRRSFATYGLKLSRWVEGMRVGLFWGVLLVGGAALLLLFGVHHQPGRRPPTMSEGVAYGVGTLVAVVLFAWRFRRKPTIASRVSAGMIVSIFIGLICVPVIVALVYGRPIIRTILQVLWLVVGASCGEEIFYRGYIQSRVNETFGRPLRFLGVKFGAGLLVSALLFGFLHTLNTVDYFHGQFTFAWGFGIANICTGLLYGCLRESTGSVVAGIITHAILDVLVIVPGLVSGS